MTASPGGHAKPDTIEAPTIAVRLRGGLLPQAAVDPAARRATRALRRRRRHGRRHRAERLPHVQHTTSQDTRPELGRKLADTTTRDGVAERVAAPAVPNSLDGALALLGPDDDLRRDVERSSLQAAKQRTPHPRSRLRPVPGSGELRRLGRLSAMHALPRFPRLQACVSAGRLVTCAKASAGQRDGPSGTKIGHASLPGAFADAAVRGLRANPAGHKDLGRLEKTHGTGTALTVLAHQRARAVSALLKGDTAVERPTFLTGERPRRGRAWRLTGP